jgi:hypothetical protein
MAAFATLEDLEKLWRPVTTAEEERAEGLLDLVSNDLRYRATLVDKDLDEMIEAQPLLADVAKSVTCDVVARTLMTSTNSEPMSQMSQSAAGYSVSGTFLVPGGGLFIKKTELQRLGLRRQKVRAVNIFGGTE